MNNLETLREKWLDERELYEQLCHRVKYTLEEKTRLSGIACIVSSRTKEVASLLKKAIRKSYADPYHEIKDKAGVRVICTYSASLPRLEEIIRESFIVHNYGYDPEKPDLDTWMVAQEKMDEFFFPGQSSLTRDGNIINDVVKDGECVCPLVKDFKLVEPSANLCLCGKNTMRTLYEWATQRPVKVELIEGCNRGGKCCHFRAELL